MSVELDVHALKPRLAEGVRLSQNERGGPQLQSDQAFMDLRPIDAAVVELLDGERDLAALGRAALDLEVPMRPMAMLGLLRRLHRVGLITGLESQAGHLFGKEKSLLRSLIGGLSDVHIFIGGLAAPLSVGRLIPAGFWPHFSLLGFVLMSALLVYAGFDGSLRGLLSVLPPAREPLPVLLLAYISLCAILSLRGLVRGVAMRSLGIKVPKAGLRLTYGVLHLEADQTWRRGVSAAARLQVALVGLSSLTWIVAVAAAAHLATHTQLPGLIAGLGLLVLMIDLAPYSKTDAWHIAGITTRIPSLRRRALRFLVRQVGRNVRRGAPMGGEEQRYLLLTSLWLLHALVVLGWAGRLLLPAALAMFSATMSGMGAEQLILSVAAVGLVSFALMLVTAAYALGLLLLMVAFLKQLGSSDERRMQTRASEPADQASFLEACEDVPFLAHLNPEARGAVSRRLLKETHEEGSPVIKQGEMGDRFCFLLEGRCDVEFEETCGMVHHVAHLEPGAFFGEVALLDAKQRTATVRTITPAKVLILGRGAFQDLIEELGVSPDQVTADLRNAGLLRKVPALSDLSPPEIDRLQSALEEVSMAAGSIVVQQGERGDALYLVRDGQCVVSHEAADGQRREVARLGAGEHFGEIALLREGVRTATVTTSTDSVLLRLPAEAFREVLLHNFETALHLDEGCADRLDALQVRA